MFRVLDQRRNHTKRRNTVVAFENCESRRLMSATDPIIIAGSDAHDVIEFHYVDYHNGHDAYVWTINGVQHSAHDVDPQYIFINTLGGIDDVYVNSTRPGQELSINTGAGDDLVALGNYNGLSFDYFHFGHTTLDMGAGKDILDVYDRTSVQPGVNPVYSMWGDHLNVGGIDQKTYKPIGGLTLEHKGVNWMQWYGSDTATTWRNNSLYVGQELTEFGGAGSDTFRVGVNNIIDGNINGSLHINGGDGSDGVMFDDAGAVSDRNYTLTRNRFSKSVVGSEYLHVDYYTENVFLSAGMGNDNIAVTDAAYGQRFYINGDVGNDYFTLNLPKLNRARFYMTGGTGNDRLHIEDTVGAKLTQNYTINETYFSRLFGSYVQYAGMKNLDFLLNSSGNAVLHVAPSRYAQFNLSDQPNSGASDEIQLVLNGVKNPQFVGGGMWNTYNFDNRKSIQCAKFAKFPKTFQSDTTIAGTVFKDANFDGLKNNGDAGLANRKVYIDRDNDGVFDFNEEFVLTDANGNFHFDHYMAGTYVIRQVLPSGSWQTTPKNKAGITVNLAGNQKVTGLLFGSASL
jgi:hypothetical protein